MKVETDIIWYNSVFVVLYNSITESTFNEHVHMHFLLFITLSDCYLIILIAIKVMISFHTISKLTLRHNGKGILQALFFIAEAYQHLSKSKSLPAAKNDD